MNIRYTKLNPAALTPLRMSETASGFDLFACLLQEVELRPMARIAIPTGIAMEIPVGYEAQIRPRSGLALKLGLGVLNSPGTIDADYRGEIKVILINLSTEVVTITPEMRIAQMVICPVVYPDLQICEELSDTQRADGGFGHTGA